jgi:hypothetical protein
VNAGGLLGGGGIGGWQGLFGGPRTLEAWTGSMQVDIGADGVALLHRVDTLLGAPGFWGSINRGEGQEGAGEALC